MSGLNPFMTINRVTDEISRITRKLGLVCEHVKGPVGFQAKPFHVRRSGNDLTIAVPPMHYIPIAEDILVSTLADRFTGSESKYFKEIVRLLNAATRALYHNHREHVLRLFEPFSAAAARRPLLIKKGTELSDDKLDEAELDFLREIMIMLSGANFNIMTEVEWEAALAEAYLVTMPVEVQHEHIDTTLIRKLWKDHHSDFAKLLPEDIRSRMLIFHRGITQLRMRDVMFSAKLDLLFDYSITWFGRWLIWGILKIFTLGRHPTREAWMASLDEHIDHLSQQHGVGTLDDELARQTAEDKLIGNAGLDIEGGKKGPEAFHEGEEVAGMSYRRTLERALPGFWKVLGNLFRPIDMYEPAFKEMVVVFRRTEEESFKTGKAENLSSETEQMLGGSNAGHNRQRQNEMDKVVKELEGDVEKMDLRNFEYPFSRNIFIKSFENVPMADLELVMPDKRIRYDTRTLFSIWLTVVVGLGLGIFTLISALNDESNSATGSVFASLGFAGALLIRAQVAFLALQAKRGKANQLMMQTMFKCSTNTQEGVVLASLRTMEAEQRKEDLLVFYALTKARRPVRLGELDDICEALLRSIFHTRVDVDIEKIVDRLEQFGLATVDSAGWIRPASLQQAVRTMQHLSAAAGAMREEDACLFVKQMLVDDKVLLGEGWGITEKTLDENNRYRNLADDHMQDPDRFALYGFKTTQVVG